MKIFTYITRYIAAAALLTVSMLTLSSCDGIIYDDEGDCDVIYRLRFRYDMNMKFADAFSNEVKSICLYAFDTNGTLVWQTIDAGEHLAAEDYSIELPLSPGKYSLMAWCGLDNSDSFTVPSISEGDKSDGLHCRLSRTYNDEEGAISNNDLNALFHGTLDVELPTDIDGGIYSYTMSLTKDTNVFRIVLQHLSGKDIDADDFTFKIEDENGWLRHDNSMRDDEPITYHAWDKYSASAGVDVIGGDFNPDGRAITDVSVAVAELTTNRLFASETRGPGKKNPMLVIRKSGQGDLVARIPVIDYALLVKGNYHRQMDDQEYLDRQDEYNMTLFLDDNNHWLSTTVIINSWRVVLNPTDL
ncbi:MAG: FimB/Mfa2 family fimbrial subunit [Muribaculaceae bacterium]|nr:FimB/Mfa2 family fimbrial subunit [Muribaculaceae bacterium]